ncbi:MAG TPA: ATP-binding protein, partial [Candidatus Nitrosocosmicus sp.]|nr:ATP-binding protein [Candidatus Nitrosocosmicus sp.]
MTLELKVHPSFFKEFATKTWISPYEIIRELIENAFDEDATRIIVTVLGNGSVVIEDDAGMDADSINKFLIVGSPHKANENLSPKLKRIRTGRYGTGRLSFLTSFDNMKIKTKLDNFHKTMVINGDALENLFAGHAQLQELIETPLKRNGTEIFLYNSKIDIDAVRLSKELKKLSILKYPLFEVYVKYSEVFNEWDLTDSQIVKSPDVQGYKIIVNVTTNPIISGEIIIAKRPLGQDEKGIAIMVGNHVVKRTTFGFDNKMNKVTGYVKCDQLTSRFADKSALIENDEYIKFNQSMKNFIVEQVLPSLTEYEDVLITREESKIYKEIDKVMGQAVMEMIQTDEEVQGFETVEFVDAAAAAANVEGDGSRSLATGHQHPFSSLPSPSTSKDNEDNTDKGNRHTQITSKDSSSDVADDLSTDSSKDQSKPTLQTERNSVVMDESDNDQIYAKSKKESGFSEPKKFSLPDYSIGQVFCNSDNNENNAETVQNTPPTPSSSSSTVISQNMASAVEPFKNVNEISDSKAPLNLDIAGAVSDSHSNYQHIANGNNNNPPVILGAENPAI